MPSPVLLYIFCLLATGLAIDAFSNYEYNTNSAHFIRPLKDRSKRDADPTTTPESPLNMKVPDDYEVDKDEETEHIYYNMTTYSNKPEVMEKYYVDVDEWLKKADVEGHSNHPSLVQSYRKAAVS
jgi:hypothetical protein